MTSITSYTKKNSPPLSLALTSWTSSSEKKNLTTQASKIAKKALESLSEPHGYLWSAQKNDTICAVLIADETVDHKGNKEILIRYLVSNVRNPTAKGTGTFLVSKLKDLAKKNLTAIVLVSDNADKYWKNQGFTINPNDPTQYRWQP